MLAAPGDDMQTETLPLLRSKALLSHSNAGQMIRFGLWVWLMLIYKVGVKSLTVIWKETADSWHSHHGAPGVAACARTHLSHSWALLWHWPCHLPVVFPVLSGFSSLSNCHCHAYSLFPNTSRDRVVIYMLTAYCHIRFNGVQSYVSSENCYFTGGDWHKLPSVSWHQPGENVPFSPQFWAASFFAADTFATHSPDTQFTDHVVVLLRDHR